MKALDRIKAKYRGSIAGWTPDLRNRFKRLRQEAHTASPAKRNQMLIDVIRDEPLTFFKLYSIAALIDQGAKVNTSNNPSLSPTKTHYFNDNRRPVATAQNDPITNMGPLEWAAYLDQQEVIEFLCEMGADVHAHNGFAADTVLTSPTRKKTAIKAMMQAGADYTSPKALLHLSDLATHHGDYELMKHVMTRGKISSSNFPVAFDMAAQRDDIATLGSYIKKHKPFLNEYHLESIIQKDAAKILEFLIRYDPAFITSELSFLGPELVEHKSTKCLTVLFEYFSTEMDMNTLELTLRNRYLANDPQFHSISDQLNYWHKKTDALNNRDVSITDDGRLTMIEKGIVYTDKRPLTLEKLTQMDNFGNNAIDYLAHKNRLSLLLNPRFWHDREAEFSSLMRHYIPYRHQSKDLIRDVLQVKAELSIRRNLKSRPKPNLHKRRRP